MIKQYNFNTGLGSPEVILEVDHSKFTEEIAKDINNFWSGAEERIEIAGDVISAALTIYAREMLQEIAFNNFKTEEWLNKRFDWSLEDQGIEGFYSLEQVGITIKECEPWFIEFDEIWLTEYT